MKRFYLTLSALLLVFNLNAQNSKKVLLFNSTKHLFSNSTVPDIFTIYLTGKSIFTGTVTFKITTASNQVIHSETISAATWCEYIDELSLKVKNDMIRKHIKEFFLPRSFRSPAISKDEYYDSDYYDKTLYDELKSDGNSIGFRYQNAMEGETAIAWSKKRNKVVSYYAID